MKKIGVYPFTKDKKRCIIRWYVFCAVKKTAARQKKKSPQTLNEGSSSKTSALPKIDPISQFRTF